MDTDCDGQLPATVPAGCAEGLCDPVEKKCRAVARDADNDGHSTNVCRAADGSSSIELGDDCDDSDPDVNPEGWDGPAADENPDNCSDGIDQDCSGVDSDGTTSTGGTCTCTPGDLQPCSQDSGGQPVVFPTEPPIGRCKLGAQTCLPSGSWGPCTDTRGPVSEICNEEDDDCDGDIDESAVGTSTWYLDADSDDHGDRNTSAVVACAAPGPEWQKDIPSDDCNDGDSETHPGAWDGPGAASADYGITAAGLSASFHVCSDCLNDPFGAAAVATRIDYAVDFTLGQGGITADMNVSDGFAARWTGTLRSGVAGTYTFYLTSDDGSRLNVKGTQIINHWSNHAATELSGTIDLAASEEVPLVLDYYEDALDAAVHLEWEGPGFARQVLRVVSAPQEGDRPDRCNDGKDNDCSNTVDDGQIHDGPLLVSCDSCAIGTARSCGAARIGVCHEGAQFCEPDGDWDSACAGTVAATSETCNTIDDDCDGIVDNNVTPACACNPGTSQDCGVCDDGTQSCTGGQWGACLGASQRLEYCRDQDSDGYCTTNCKLACAGDVDNTWKLKTTQCVAGTDCNDNDSQMRPGLPEECDGKDNNCVGGVDEGLIGDPCLVAEGTPCQASGRLRCVNGDYDPPNCDATALPPQFEACDNVDNDCDGIPDDGSYLGDPNYPDAACFTCVTPSTTTWMTGTPEAGDADFQSNGPNVYSRFDFRIGTGSYAGELWVDACLLMQETGSGDSTGHACRSNAFTVKVGNTTVFADQVISAPITGNFSWGGHDDYLFMYTDDDESSGRTDLGTTNVSGSSISSFDWKCAGQTPGADIAGSGFAGCEFSNMNCVTVRYSP